MPVVNRRFSDDFDVYVGRPTKWGNPYTHLHATAEANSDLTLVGTRHEAVDKYALHLLETIIKGEIRLFELAALREKRLGCWCVPELCHGTILEQAAEWAYERLNP